MSSFFVWFTLYLTFVPASSFISLNLSTYFPPVFIPFLFSIFLCFSSLVPFLHSFLFYFPFFLLTSFPYLELPSDLISRLFCDFNCRFCNFPFSFLLFFSHIIFSPFSFSPFFYHPRFLPLSLSPLPLLPPSSSSSSVVFFWVRQREGGGKVWGDLGNLILVAPHFRAVCLSPHQPSAVFNFTCSPSSSQSSSSSSSSSSLFSEI